MMRIKQEEYLRLTEEVIWKLDVIKTSISEETSKKQIVEGMVDLGFATALKILYQDGQITSEGLDTGLSYLEDYLQRRVLKDIQEWEEEEE